MFESAELGHKIEKDEYEKRVPELRLQLLDAQYDLKEAAKFSVIILINGVEGAGKGETVNLLNEWMDPRYIETHGFNVSSEEENLHPPMWRFWRVLPPQGKIGIFFGNWYTDPIIHRAQKMTGNAGLDQSAAEINRFEKMLVSEGVCLIKFWFHLSKKAQKHRLKTLESNPKTRWRVTERDWDLLKQYDDYRKICERILRQTSTAEAPWNVIEGGDERYRNLAVSDIILTRVQHQLAANEKPRQAGISPPLQSSIDKLNILKSLNPSQPLEKKDYEKELEKYQGRLNLLVRDKKFRKRSLIAVFEGFDAAGKGGSIRRVTGALDARYYNIIPVAAPNEDERKRPYLWRFWRHIPKPGRVVIFDRSWYGRVLVERVEGFCAESDWMRAYKEINDFESQLAEHDLVLAKFFLVIGKDEQLRRFEERKKIGFKRFKITDEDWRNREKWDLYESAINDMVDRTSTELAPWTLVEANNKYYARIKVLKTLCDAVENSF